MSRRSFPWALGLLLAAGCARNAAEQLVSSDEQVRQAALSKLESADITRQREVIPLLVERLSDENGNVRRRAVQALSRTGAVAVNPLLRALRSASPRMRASAAESLGFLGAAAKSAAGPLVEAEQDKDGDVRLWASVSLNRVKATMTPTEIQLFRLLYGKKEVVSPKDEIKSAAFSPGDPRAELNALRGAGMKERAQAILSLVERGPLAVPSLLTALTDPDEAVRDGAAEALRLMTQDQADADEAVVSFLRQGHPPSRAAYDKAFAGLDLSAAASVDKLAVLTASDSLCVRLEAVRALGVQGGRAKGAAPALRAAAEKDGHPLIRRAALRALRRVLRPEPTEAQAALARQLEGVWSKMIERLSRGEMEEALGFFAPAQRDEYRAAFLALGRELPTVARSLQGKLSFREAFGDSLVTLDGGAFIGGVHQELLVQFVKDEKNEWKIRGF